MKLSVLWAVPVSGLVWSGCSEPPGAGGAAGGGAMPPSPVVVAKARQEPVAETLPLVGSLLPDEMVEIKSEIPGRIGAILFREGQHVRQGHVLVRLDDRKATNEVAEAEANFQLSRANYERDKKLFAENLISSEAFDRSSSVFDVNSAVLALRKEQLEDLEIRAPFDGITGAQTVSPGQVINQNQVLTWLVDLEPVKLEMEVPERFLGQVRVGQVIEFHVAAYPERRFQGEVFFVSPYVNDATRTALVKARADNQDELLKPGMFANLELTLTIRDEAVVIPEEAITRLMDGDRANLFVVEADNTAQLREVKVGVRMPGRLEVVEGLREGERVIVEGHQKIGPGMKVAPVEGPSKGGAGEGAKG